MTLAIDPGATVTWAHDVAGNMVATATFQSLTDRLCIDSHAEIELDAAEWPVFDVAASAPPTRLPIVLRVDGPRRLAIPQHDDPIGRLRAWSKAFVRGASTDTLALLKDLNAGVTAWISYQERDDEGTQTPIETLNRSWGSCRDMAVSVRRGRQDPRIWRAHRLRIHAQPPLKGTGSAGAGSTHAWAEVYIPGAGWITFDPTNRSVGAPT